MTSAVQEVTTQELQEKHPQAMEESTDDSDSDLPELYDASESDSQRSPSPSKEIQEAASACSKAPDAKEVEEALRAYAEKFGESRDGEVQGYNRRAFPWYSGEATNDKKEFDMQDLQAVLRKGPKKEKKTGKALGRGLRR